MTVGVLDTGIQGNHPDLKNQISSSDLHRDCTVNPIKKVAKADLTDFDGHGTHVAGTIGAQGNNSIGISGVAQSISLVSLQVFEEKGDSSTRNLARAINFAASVNIPILNFSGGSADKDTKVLNALEGYTGLFICCSGNNGENNDNNIYYPSDYSRDPSVGNRIISVGSY